MNRNELTQLQSLPLDVKIAKTRLRIREWYTHMNGDIYVSFSGGLDSTVLLHIVRSMYPNTPAVFCDAFEYPEIRDFVRTVYDVTWIKPKMTFAEVIQKWGYPFPSKEQSQYIYEYQTGKSEVLRTIRVHGNKHGQGKIFDKWIPLANSSIKISHRCCIELKKKPFHKYERTTGLAPILGLRAEESSHRMREYLKKGCNIYDVARPVSRPIGFWTDQDVLQYIVDNNIPYAKSIYGNIESIDGKLQCTGVSRTGCVGCMFGVQLDKSPNRFQQLHKSHPKLWDYCVNTLGIGTVLDFVGIPTSPGV